MKKLKISILLLLIFTIIIHVNYIYATEPETEETVVEEEATVTDEEATNTDASQESQEVVQEDVIDGSLSSFAPSTVTSVSTLDNYEKANLHLSNILSIILISIGVVLIIFAGAIMIRLKG